MLLLDGGDSLFKGSETTAPVISDQGAIVVEAMNAMRYDAMALGRRDLEAPAAVVRARFEEAQFPILSANVDPAGLLPNVQPYLLRQVDGHTIAIIGATSETVERRFQALGVDLTVENAVDSVQRAAGEVRGKADIIIVLSNLQREESERLAQAVPGIDVVVDVYRGSWFAPSAVEGVEGQVVLHASGTLGEYLGVLSVHFDAQGQVVSFEGYASPLTLEYGDDLEIVEIMRKHARQQ